MRNISKSKVIQRISFENPWWDTRAIDAHYGAMTRRAYFRLFWALVAESTVRRAAILMGPRRVGKTVLLFHVIQQLIDEGHDPARIVYLSVDHPVFNGLGLDELVELAREASSAGTNGLDGYIFFFDEIQYLRDWEIHLKSLVDSHPRTRWIASGSSAAALRLKSVESGAGRFTDFLLPPLTFHEYILLLGKQSLVERGEEYPFVATDLEALNSEFIDYLNFGGYPEVALSSEVRANPGRYIRHDIVEKVLLRDLPSLYGITDIQELNSLFTTLAFNTADELSLEALSKRAGVAKNTLKRYIEYLEAAFLVKRVHRIDQNSRRFERAVRFKVYLTNPSIRAALFAPITSDDEDMGAMVETGVFAQWFHSTSTDLHYARWKDGEIDIVNLRPDQRPGWVVETKWSDRHVENANELRQLIEFCRAHRLGDAIVTTRTVLDVATHGGVMVQHVPSALYCYTVGYGLVSSRAG